MVDRHLRMLSDLLLRSLDVILHSFNRLKDDTASERILECADIVLSNEEGESVFVV